MELTKITKEKQILKLETFLEENDRQMTMILQSLQWDRKHLLEKHALVECQYDSNHRVPPDKLLGHEQVCFLKSQGYSEQAHLLPSPLDPNASTLVKLSSDNIAGILDNASRCEAVFKRGAGCSGHQPLTADRLQATYTSDERRAIHDAVVRQAPSCHDLSDLALLSAKDEGGTDSKAKSRLEVLAELRDMKRRRAKYHVASKTRNYSDVLRDVISTQMELYNQAHDNVKNEIKKEEPDSKDKIEDVERPLDKNTIRNKDNALNRRHQSNREYSSGTSKHSYSESQYSKHSDEYYHRKRKYDEKYEPEKYSRTEKDYKSTHHKSCHDNDYKSDRRERRDKYASSSTSRGERGKYNDDKEPHKRKRSRDIDDKRVNYIKREESASEEPDFRKNESSKPKGSELNDNYRETESDCYDVSDNDLGHKNNGKQKHVEVKIKKELDDSHEKTPKSNEKSRDPNREHCDSKTKKRKEKRHDDYRSKERRHDEIRHPAQETEKVVEKTKSNWSDDSEEIYHKTSKEKYESSKTGHKNRYYHSNEDKTRTYEKDEAYDRKQYRKSKHDKDYEDRYYNSSRDHSSDNKSRYKEGSRSYGGDDHRKSKHESKKYNNRHER